MKIYEADRLWGRIQKPKPMVIGSMPRVELDLYDLIPDDSSGFNLAKKQISARVNHIAFYAEFINQATVRRTIVEQEMHFRDMVSDLEEQDLMEFFQTHGLSSNDYYVVKQAISRNLWKLCSADPYISSCACLALNNQFKLLVPEFLFTVVGNQIFVYVEDQDEPTYTSRVFEPYAVGATLTRVSGAVSDLNRWFIISELDVAVYRNKLNMLVEAANNELKGI